VESSDQVHKGVDVGTGLSSLYLNQVVGEDVLLPKQLNFALEVV